MKTKFSHILAVHKRGLRELHKVSPKLFPVMTLSAVVSAVIPYVTVYFSAKILTELALLRRTDVLWQWVVAGVAAMGFLGIIHAFLQMCIRDRGGDCPRCRNFMKPASEV